ncbi:MAG: PH domain-containing protein [Candidatus Saccharimonadales bacterium]
MANEEHTIEGVAPGENMLHVVHRSFVGLLLVYIQVGVGFIAGAVLLYFLTPVVFSDIETSRQNLYASVAVGLIAVLLWLVLLIYTYIYRQSKLIITDKNLTQVLQQGLFNRKVSELSMSNVEDVTANQRGVFASIFGYGNLNVETAGEQNNFNFKFCPKPNFYGRIILDARQAYIDTGRTNP